MNVNNEMLLMQYFRVGSRIKSRSIALQTKRVFPLEVPAKIQPPVTIDSAEDNEEKQICI